MIFWRQREFALHLNSNPKPRGGYLKGLIATLWFAGAVMAIAEVDPNFYKVEMKKPGQKEAKTMPIKVLPKENAVELTLKPTSFDEMKKRKTGQKVSALLESNWTVGTIEVVNGTIEGMKFPDSLNNLSLTRLDRMNTVISYIDRVKKMWLLPEWINAVPERRGNDIIITFRREWRKLIRDYESFDRTKNEFDDFASWLRWRRSDLGRELRYK